jgi:uncharacterized protein with PIN domain
MVIDSSAILALLFSSLKRTTSDGNRRIIRLMSVASGLEAAIVVEARLGAAGGRSSISCSTKPASSSSR